MTHRLEVVDGEFDVEGLGHGNQVQHCVRRSAEGHHGDHGVLEGGTSHDVLRFKILKRNRQPNDNDRRAGRGGQGRVANAAMF